MTVYSLLLARPPIPSFSLDLLVVVRGEGAIGMPAVVLGRDRTVGSVQAGRGNHRACARTVAVAVGPCSEFQRHKREPCTRHDARRAQSGSHTPASGSWSISNIHSSWTRARAKRANMGVLKRLIVRGKNPRTEILEAASTTHRMAVPTLQLVAELQGHTDRVRVLAGRAARWLANACPA